MQPKSVHNEYREQYNKMLFDDQTQSMLASRQTIIKQTPDREAKLGSIEVPPIKLKVKKKAHNARNQPSEQNILLTKSAIGHEDASHEHVSTKEDPKERFTNISTHHSHQGFESEALTNFQLINSFVPAQLAIDRPSAGMFVGPEANKLNVQNKSLACQQQMLSMSAN